MPDDFLITLTTEETRVIKLETGAPGPRGEKGETGATGPQGPQGDVGPAGPQGEQGIKGDKGDTGTQGIQGEIGPAGPKGDTGSQGLQGIQGEIGPQGVKGDQGDVGPAGAAGATGPQGIQGIKGDTGLTGPQGPQGETGATGAAGPGVAAGGSAGQILAKNSATDYDTHWVDVGGGTVDSVNSQIGVVVLDAADVGAEPALGNPDTDGKVLSSTAAGVRSWVTAGGSSFSPTITDLIDKDIIKYDNTAGEWINAPEDGSSRNIVPHAWWRVIITELYMGNYARILEIQFRTIAGEAEQASGGSCGAVGSFSTPAQVFDGSMTGYSTASSPGDGVYYHFAEPKIVRELAIAINNTGNRFNACRLEYSDDGSAWTTYTTYTIQSGEWTAGVFLALAATDQSVQPKFIKATISSPASGQYVKYDGTKWVNANLPYPIDLWNGSGSLAASQVVLVRKAQVAFTLPASLTGSHALLQTAATASTVLTITKNGTSIGTITFAASGTVGTFTFSAAVSFAVGDILKITAPASADATAAGLSINLLGVM